MKNIFIFILLVSLLACEGKQTSKTQVSADIKVQNFDWLLGSWTRTNDEPGKETFEIWTKQTDHLYLGKGFIMENKDTIWEERIRLKENDSIWRFEVFGKGESTPTVFDLTQIEPLGFVCENEQNEFPKRIEYYRASEKLMAEISNPEMKIIFEFKGN